MTRAAANYALELAEFPPPLRSTSEPERAEPKTARKVVTPPDHVAGDSHRAHGTYVKYVVERCRCEPCRAANRAYETRRVHAMARPDEVWVPYVSAGPARAHIRRLAELGVGAKTVAKLSGVPHGSVAKLVYGDPKRGMAPSKRIRPETARRILAIRVEDAAGAQKIDAAPTWRLLDELLAKGWVKSHLASLIQGRPTRSLQIRRTRVRASTARRVEALYAQLADVTPPPRRSRSDKEHGSAS